MKTREEKQKKYAEKLKRASEKIRKKRSFWSLFPLRFLVVLVACACVFCAIFINLRKFELSAQNETLDKYSEKLTQQVYSFLEYQDGYDLHADLKNVTSIDQWVLSTKNYDSILPLILLEKGYWGIYDYSNEQWLTELSEDSFTYKLFYKLDKDVVAHVYNIADEQKDLVRPYASVSKITSNFIVYSGYIDGRTLYIEKYSIGLDGDIEKAELGDMSGYEHFELELIPDMDNIDAENYDEAIYWNGLNMIYGKLGSYDICANGDVRNASVRKIEQDSEGSVTVNGKLNVQEKTEAKKKLDEFLEIYKEANKDILDNETLNYGNDTFLQNKITSSRFWNISIVSYENKMYGVVYTGCAALADNRIMVLFIAFIVATIILAAGISLLWTRSAYLKYKLQHDIYEYRMMVSNTMAHDLKSPLMAISGYVDNLIENTNPDKNEHYLQEISKKTAYMNELIGNTLELAKSEELVVKKREPLAVHECIRHIQMILAEQIVQKELKVNISGTKTLECDTGAMTIVLRNVLENAVKYCEAGGNIDICLSEGEMVFRNDCRALDADVNTLFEAYVKDDRSRTGTKGNGLGLAIVKSICDAHGYDVGAEYKNQKFAIIITA